MYGINVGQTLPETVEVAQKILKDVTMLPIEPFNQPLPDPPVKGATLVVSIDLEADGCDAKSGTDVVSIGLVGVDWGTLKVVLRYEASFSYYTSGPPIPLSPDRVINPFWIDKNTNKPNEGWTRLVNAQRNRLKVATELSEIIGDLRKRGWKIHVAARPAGYDFRQLVGFFESCDLENPFGFGGAGDLTCIGQKIAAFQLALGLPVTSFNEVMKNVIGRNALTHGGLQDAIDQIVTFSVVERMMAAVGVSFQKLTTQGPLSWTDQDQARLDELTSLLRKH